MGQGKRPGPSQPCLIFFCPWFTDKSVLCWNCP